jgi:hypothetical protein
MSGQKAPDTIACPVCSSELSLEHLLGHLDDEQAFSRLVALSVPMAHLVVRYIGLFTPEKQRLTLRKKVRLIQQLLPDLQREAITHRGRDWPAPLEHWGKGIEQMLAARAAGRLDLPMSGHGYLYAVLAGMADKLEAQAEREAEDTKRHGPRAATVNAAQPVQANPVLAALDAQSQRAVPVTAQARELLANLRRGHAP